MQISGHSLQRYEPKGEESAFASFAQGQGKGVCFIRSVLVWLTTPLPPQLENKRRGEGRVN